MWGLGVGGEGSVGGGKGGCDRRIEFLVKIKRKIGGGVGGQGRCNREVKFF